MKRVSKSFLRLIIACLVGFICRLPTATGSGDRDTLCANTQEISNWGGDFASIESFCSGGSPLSSSWPGFVNGSSTSISFYEVVSVRRIATVPEFVTALNDLTQLRLYDSTFTSACHGLSIHCNGSLSLAADAVTRHDARHCPQIVL